MEYLVEVAGEALGERERLAFMPATFYCDI